MPYCPRCGKEVLITDRYCFNCGQNVDRQIGGPTTAVASASGQQWIPQAPKTASKSPGGAAALNFFFPGMGYIYAGFGRDLGEVIFGAFVFVFFFVGFEVGYLINIITYVPPAAPVEVSPYAALILLAFLLPFAFAYDGYRRAKSA